MVIYLNTQVAYDKDVNAKNEKGLFSGVFILDKYSRKEVNKVKQCRKFGKT